MDGKEETLTGDMTARALRDTSSEPPTRQRKDWSALRVIVGSEVGGDTGALVGGASDASTLPTGS